MTSYLPYNHTNILLHVNECKWSLNGMFFYMEVCVLYHECCISLFILHLSIMNYLSSVFSQVIVWDQALVGPIGLIAEVPFLLQLGVFKMIRLPVNRVADIDQYKEADEFVFFVRPMLNIVDLIANAIG